MRRTFKALVIIVLLTIAGCSNSVKENNEAPAEIETVNAYFTGTIKEISGDRALVYAKLGGSKGKVFVDLSVNNDETFQVADKIKVGYDGIIKESNPAQIHTISVELIDSNIR